MQEKPKEREREREKVEMRPLKDLSLTSFVALRSPKEEEQRHPLVDEPEDEDEDAAEVVAEEEDVPVHAVLRSFLKA